MTKSAGAYVLTWMRAEFGAFMGGLVLALVGGLLTYGLTDRSEPPEPREPAEATLRSVATWPEGATIGAAVAAQEWLGRVGAPGIPTMLALHDPGMLAELHARCVAPRDPTGTCHYSATIAVGAGPQAVALELPGDADPSCVAAAACVAQASAELWVPRPSGSDEPITLQLWLRLQPVERDPDKLRRGLLVYREDVAAARAQGMFGAGDPQADFAVLRQEALIAELERQQEAMR